MLQGCGILRPDWLEGATYEVGRKQGSCTFPVGQLAWLRCRPNCHMYLKHSTETLACCCCCSLAQGAEELRGIQTYKFNKPGLQANYYWVTADSLQLPVELDQVRRCERGFGIGMNMARPALGFSDAPQAAACGAGKDLSGR